MTDIELASIAAHNLAKPTVSDCLVTTESGSVYEIRDGHVTRHRNDNLGVLRRDGESLLIHAANQPVVGCGWNLLIQIREDDVPTLRRTTPVVAVVPMPNGLVPVEQVEALLRLLGPAEMTPTATRMFRKLIKQHVA